MGTVASDLSPPYNLSGCERGRDGVERRGGLRAVGAAGLRHVGAAAAALAAERLGATAHQLDRVESRCEVRRHSDHEARLALVGDADDLTKRFNAVDLVRTGAAALGGKGGGGRPDMAQAGGPDGSKTGEALDAIAQALGAA